MTAENIFRRSPPCVLSSSQDVAKAIQLLESAEPTEESFGGSFVRLRVDREAQGKTEFRALVDQTGVVRGVSGGLRRLPPGPLHELIALIEARCN